MGAHEDHESEHDEKNETYRYFEGAFDMEEFLFEEPNASVLAVEAIFHSPKPLPVKARWWRFAVGRHGGLGRVGIGEGMRLG